jgi:hypothetical protein
MASKKARELAVIVCTNARGVFFGYQTEAALKGETVKLLRARNCVYWSAATKGFMGLASTGPAAGSKIGPQVPSIDLRGITAVVECSPEAAASWERGVWG